MSYMNKKQSIIRNDNSGMIILYSKKCQTQRKIIIIINRRGGIERFKMNQMSMKKKQHQDSKEIVQEAEEWGQGSKESCGRMKMENEKWIH